MKAKTETTQLARRIIAEVRDVIEGVDGSSAASREYEMFHEDWQEAERAVAMVLKTERDARNGDSPREPLTKEETLDGWWTCAGCNSRYQFINVPVRGINTGVPTTVQWDFPGCKTWRCMCGGCAEKHYRRKRLRGRRRWFIRATRAWRAAVAVGALLAGAGLLARSVTWSWWY